MCAILYLSANLTFARTNSKMCSAMSSAARVYQRRGVIRGRPNKVSRVSCACGSCFVFQFAYSDGSPWSTEFAVDQCRKRDLNS